MRPRHLEGRHSGYAKHGVKALEDWLQREAVKNVNAVNDAIRSATPWHAKLDA